MAKRLSWAVRIERAEKRGKFNEADSDLASEWRSCAVGEKHNWHSIAPDADARADEWNKWVKQSISELGVAFADAVEDNDFAAAKRLYAEIMALP